jgi:hypothetical protein
VADPRPQNLRECEVNSKRDFEPGSDQRRISFNRPDVALRLETTRLSSFPIRLVVDDRTVHLDCNDAFQSYFQVQNDSSPYID